MKSKVIQAIRQTGFAIISFLFFSFSELESKKQFTQATHVTQRSLRSTTQIPSVIACKAVRQGSTMLIIEKFRVGRTWWYKKIDAICRGQTCRLRGVTHAHARTALMRGDYSSLWLSHVDCRSMWCTHAGAWWERWDVVRVQHSILYWASLSRDTSTQLWLRMCVSVHRPPWHIREEMSEQCSVAKLTTGRWHNIFTHIRTLSRKQTQRLSSTEGFANNDSNKWPLRVSW